jgi:TRAP transporter TAXI family solute receptor
MKEYLRIFGFGFLLVVGGFVLAFQFVKPSPPKSITIATGSTSGAYFAYAQKYKDLLAEQGIELTIINTAGSIDNIQRLQSGEVDIAFVQSGTGQPNNSVHQQADQLENKRALVSLASVYYEPLWLFMQSHQAAFKTSDLQGKRIAIGAAGSGTQALAKIVLNNNGISENNTAFLQMASDKAAAALLDGKVDYVFLVSSVQAPLVQKLLLESSLMPFDFERAKAYTRRYRFLSATELPQGVVDFKRNLPARDVNLISAAATLVADENIHPALVALLMQVFEKVHGAGGILEQPSEFPSQRYVDFPVDASAKRFFDHGPPLLQRYLPFWAAVLVNQLKVFLIPLIALMIPLIRVLPILYRWRVRSRIYRWYRDLKEIERQANANDMADEIRQQLLSQLQQMHRDLMEESIPLSYHDELYHLRLHIQLVRDGLLANDD